MTKEKLFTPYQILMIVVLAAIQFAIILDFMVLSPLGAQLIPKLNITPAQFGWVVSAYAFSAGASGLLAAGFADRYDRKKLLLFFFSGFIIGTFLCGIATTYWFLMIARIVTGIFGGVIGSIAFAIITDLFDVNVRGRVMGFVQMAFAASQVLGLPIGLYLSNIWDWHAPFLMIVVLSIGFWVLIFVKMEPVSAHLSLQTNQSPLARFAQTLSSRYYLRTFVTTALLATGGFMLMPFGAAYGVNNLKLDMTDLPTIYLATGIGSIVMGPIIGRMTDRIGPIWVFAGGSALAIVLVLIYCNLGATPLWAVIGLNVLLFIGITARMISSSALMSAVPTPADRGVFMSINASISQISGGIAAAVAGLIIHQNETGYLENYPILGWVVTASMLICVGLMYRIYTQQNLQKTSS